MTRSQRRWHLTLWCVLAPLLIALVVLAFVNRPDAILDAGAPR